jgi:hypothetical protein
MRRRRVTRYVCLIPVMFLLSGCVGGAYMTLDAKDPVGAAIADVNGDGHPDIVVLNGSTNTVTVRLQGPYGGFGNSYTMKLPSGAKPSAIVAGTFLANGKPTVVVANRGDDSISIFDKFGPGRTPTKTITLGPGSAPSALAVGDVTGDGNTDLLVATRQPTFPGCPTKGCVLVFRDKGNGLAYSYAAYPTGTDPSVDYNPVSIAIGQLWGGARPEIAVVNRGTNQAVVIETKNSGFETAASYTTLDVHAPTDVQIDSGQLAVHSSSGDGRLFKATGPGHLNVTARLSGPGALYDGEYVSYDPSTGAVHSKSFNSNGSNLFKGATDLVTGNLDHDNGLDLVGLSQGFGRIIVFTTGAQWAGPTTVDFGTVPVGSSVTRVVTGTLYTLATADVDLSVSGNSTGLASFPVVRTCGTGGTGRVCQIPVTFAPTSPGAKQITLGVTAWYDKTTDQEYPFAWGHPEITITGNAVAASTPPPPSSPAGELLTGVADDYGKFADDAGASFFSTVRSLGMGENRMTVLWNPGETAPGPPDTTFLDRSIAEAQRQGVRVVLSIYPAAASQHDPEQFCTFARAVAQRYPYVKEFIVGNEPNKSDFWSPVDPAAYTQLLARCYDELHPLGVAVVGGALSARQVGSGMSPVAFLAGMGAAYRSLDRTAPLMDALSFHPYPNPDRISLGPDAGYDWPNAGPPDLDRVKQAFEDAFAGTAQPTFASGLRMVIDEIGWQAAILPQYASLYTGSENSATVDESQQAQFYAAEIARVECDPQVSDLLLLHLVDEAQLNATATSGGWQSGLLRADLSQRPAFAAVKAAIAAGCTGAVHTWTPAKSVVGGSITLNASRQQVRVGGKTQPGVKFTVGASAAEGVAWKITVTNGAGKIVASKQGTRAAPFNTGTFTTPILVGRGSYSAAMTMTATQNHARTLTVTKSGTSA